MARRHDLEQLKTGEPFDLLVIGGGATGCGIALDAASRGLKTALVEMLDFAEGTSSRSTKLLHGGVRYLEMAVKRLDPVQYRLVKDGLFERAVLLRNAPHLTSRLPLVTPLYAWMDVPYIFAGLKLYDMLAGKKGIGRSRLVSRAEALGRFPLLKADGLKAGVLYYDGQFSDARMAVTLAMTARSYGAAAANHLEAMGFVRRGGKIGAVAVRDGLSGEEWEIPARGVINAAGPFADEVRRLDDPNAPPILKVSSGIHIVLSRRFPPPEAGLMIPKTEDGRILFILPWQGHTVIGTTDEPADLCHHPRPRQEEIAYLLRHVGSYFNLKVTEEDITSVWSGLRPLVSESDVADTARLARDYVIRQSDSGLLTVTGGKWTTYRRMAEDAVDRAVEAFGLPHSECRTTEIPLLGGAGFSSGGDVALADEFHLPDDVACHLHRAYGDRAPEVARLAADGLGERLHPDHPYLEAEAVYAARSESAERAMDLLARRTPLALLDREGARSAAPRVIELMGGELYWDDFRRRSEAEEVERRMKEGI